VWIDALCVNQGDLEERSEQVKLMRDIYSQTWRVIVWLGEDEANDAITAIRIIEKAADYCYADVNASNEDGEDLDRKLQTEQLDFELPWSEKKRERDFPPLKRDPRVSNGTEWAAVSRLFSNTWFTRIWTVQEVAFAPTVMYVGANEVTWTRVAAAAKWLLAKSYTFVVQDSARYRQAWLIYYLHLIQPPLPLYKLLSFIKSNSTDPRDKIFALLGFMDQESRASPFLQQTTERMS
jgi:hypothetical protein